MGINDLYDRHGSEQEEKNGCYLAEVLQQMMLGFVYVGSTQNIDRPKDHAGDERRGSLVDFYAVLKCDGRIAKHK